jgi:hypothetical protein
MSTMFSLLPGVEAVLIEWKNLFLFLSPDTFTSPPLPRRYRVLFRPQAPLGDLSSPHSPIVAKWYKIHKKKGKAMIDPAKIVKF